MLQKIVWKLTLFNDIKNLYFVCWQVIIFQGRQDLAVSYNNDTQSFELTSPRLEARISHLRWIFHRDTKREARFWEKFCLVKQTSSRTKPGMSLSFPSPFLPLPSGQSLSSKPSLLAPTLHSQSRLVRRTYQKNIPSGRSLSFKQEPKF